jgi:hypothetical protein
VLQSLSSIYNVIFLQEHFATKHGINTLTLDGMKSYSMPTRKLYKRGRPSGELVTFVKSTLRSSLFELNDHYLALRVDSSVYICVYLPSDYSNHQSGRLFALSYEKLGSCVEKKSGSSFTLCYSRIL